MLSHLITSAIDLESLQGHTPGPWIAVGRWVEHPRDDIPDICTTDPKVMGPAGRSDAECCANARLIAAAPVLLAEVRRLRDRIRELTLYAAGVEARRDALAARLEAIELAEPVAWIEHELQGTGARHLHFERRPDCLRDDVIAPRWTALIARAEPGTAMQPPAAEQKRQSPPADGCGACGDACNSRRSCRLADESPTRAQLEAQLDAAMDQIQQAFDDDDICEEGGAA